MERRTAKGFVVALAIVAAVLVAGWMGLSAVTGEGEPCYTRVDNACIRDSGDSDMPYEYTLTAYDERGRSRDVAFKTTRELRDGAYLMMRVLPVRGVVSWEEVALEDVPSAARDMLGKEEGSAS